MTVPTLVRSQPPHPLLTAVHIWCKESIMKRRKSITFTEKQNLDIEAEAKRLTVSFAEAVRLIVGKFFETRGL